jgi:retron-type reverse transcriptase
VGSIVMGIRSTATKVNTIWLGTWTGWLAKGEVPLKAAPKAICSRRSPLKMAGIVRSVGPVGMAREAVRTNAGAAGVDRIRVPFFEKDSQERLLAVNERLTKNSCRPQAIRRVNIPKAGSSETRPLGIPTVTDRVVQAALKMGIPDPLDH